MKELKYPFDVEFIIKNKRKIKRELLEKEGLIDKKIAILGGSTTSEIKNILEIFLLNYGIKPIFYESEYNKYYEDAVFENKELDNFKPDIIYIHTSNRNLSLLPNILDDEKLFQIWESLYNKFDTTIIQNNFEYPYYRILGNKDVSDIHGRINFINKFYIIIYHRCR